MPGSGPIKQRDRGASGGQLLTALAQCQLLGGHGLVALDRDRADTAAQQLSAVAPVASTTAAGLARRFGPQQFAGIEAGLATVLAGLWIGCRPNAAPRCAAGPDDRHGLHEVEVYGGANAAWPTTTPGSGPAARTWPPGPRPGWCWRRPVGR